eukprot:84916_1
MGKCLSTKPPADYRSPFTPEKAPVPTPKTRPQSGDFVLEDTKQTVKPKEYTTTTANGMKYRKMSTDSERDTDVEHGVGGIHLEYEEQNIVIDEHIIIQSYVKIYDEKQEEYQHYGLLLNQKQCKLYLVNPHYFHIWTEFEKLSKINSVLTSDRHNHKTQCNTMTFGQKDAEEMVSNLCSNRLQNINMGNAINFLMQNKYEIEKQILVNNEWDMNLSTLLKMDSDLFDKYVNHIVITQYEHKHVKHILSFFRAFGYIVKYECVDTMHDEPQLHIIFMDDILLKDVPTLNDKLCQSLLNQLGHSLQEITIQITPFYDQIIHSTEHAEDTDLAARGDIKILDLQSSFVSVEPFTEFNNAEFDAFLYGFRLNANPKTNQQHLLCVLDDNNKRFEWITHLEFMLSNNQFIKRKYSSKLRNKRSVHVNLDKRLFGRTNTCNPNASCTHTDRLTAMNTLYVNNQDDIVDLMLNRNIDLIAIYESYIHCVMDTDHTQTHSHCHLNCSTCIHYIRFNAEKHSKENRTKYYNEHVIMNCDIIYILDQIHCFLCHSNNKANHNTKSSTRRRRNSQKWIRNWGDDEKQSNQKHGNTKHYFGGQWMDYWSPYNAMDRQDSTADIFIDDNYDHDHDIATVFPQYDTLKQELTQNTVCRLNEDDYNDIYKRSVSLLSTRFCQKHMNALRDPSLNEKMGIAPGSRITVNHIMSILIYCNYFGVSSQWIESMQLRLSASNTDDECEFAHFYRYLAELCPLFGCDMKDHEYLYIVSFDKILFKEWNQTIHFPISVTPPLDITQSFMKELRQYQHAGDEDDAKSNDRKNILKLAHCKSRMDGMNDLSCKMASRVFDVRWLSDSYDEDERFIMTSSVHIYDILLDQRRSCLKDIYAIRLFQRIMNGSFLNCIAGLNQMETQKKLFALIQNHIYSNARRKALEKLPSFEYIQDIFEDIVREAIEGVIWLNKSELSKLKCKELALQIYNVKHNEPGTLLKHYDFNKEQIKCVREYEFKIDEKALEGLIEGNDIITSEDMEYVMDSDEEDKISLYFELSKKLVIHKHSDTCDTKEFECFLLCNLIFLPKTMDKVLIECNVFCDDLNREMTFEPVWASKDSDNVGGLLLNKDLTKNMNGLQSLTFVISLKVLQTNAVSSPAKSILSRFPIIK